MNRLLLLLLTLPYFGSSQLTDDIGFKQSNVLLPPLTADYHKIFDGFPIGGSFFNYGSNNADSVYISATILGSQGVVFTDTVGPLTINSGDSITIYENYPNSFAPFNPLPNTATPGEYQLRYETFFTGDLNPLNNTTELPFSLQNSGTITLTNTSLGPQGKLNHQTYPYPDSASYFQRCTYWTEPNTNYFSENPYPYGLIGLEFVPHVDSSALLLHQEIFLNIYEWNDPWVNLSDPTFNAPNGAFQNMNLISWGAYYPSSESENDSVIYAPIYPAFLPTSNKRYVACLQSFDPELSFGVDSTVNYSKTHTLEKQPAHLIQIDTNWRLGSPSEGVPSIGLRFVSLAWGLDEKKDKVGHGFPNPTSSIIRFKTQASGLANYSIFNLAGRAILEGNAHLNSNSLELNVQTLPSGTYLLRVETDHDRIETFRFVKEPF